MYHTHSYAFKWVYDLPELDLNQWEFLLNLFSTVHTCKEDVKYMEHEILKCRFEFDDRPLIEAIKKSFSLKENKKILNKKLTLLAVSNIVSSNRFGLLRNQHHKLIVK